MKTFWYWLTHHLEMADETDRQTERERERERVAVCSPTGAGYGFVDFDSEQAAELAVRALKAEGRQAQMARVGDCLPLV